MILSLFLIYSPENDSRPKSRNLEHLTWNMLQCQNVLSAKKKKKKKLNGDMSKVHRNQWKEFPMVEDRTILVKEINKVVLDYSQCKSK